MRQIIQNLGLIIFFIAIAILVIGLFQDMNNNNYLVISGLLIVVGLVAHVVVNKKFM